MAVIKRNPDVQTFKPRWPDLTSLPLDQLRLTYDRPSDTLFVDFSGEARPAASVPLERGDRDYVYARVDPETDAVVGVQIEHFLSYAIEQHPELIDVLDISTLVDIDRDDLSLISRHRSERPQAGHIAILLADLLRPSRQRAWEELEFLAAGAIRHQRSAVKELAPQIAVIGGVGSPSC